jgi:hypothetical protein
MTWSLPALLQGLHKGIHNRLHTAREVAGHPVLKGDAAETVWLSMLGDYLPERYRAKRAVVVDSNGTFSHQIDIVIFDRQYSPFVFHQDGLDVVPAESVYAVFEAKQVITADEITYAQDKAASVRALHRTSLPIPHAGGVAEPKVPHVILAGLVTLESGWKPPLGDTLIKNLLARQKEHTLDLGCVAAHGIFARQDDDSYLIEENGMAATAFLFELIARLQALATVPMIDIRAYAAWLNA